MKSRKSVGRKICLSQTTVKTRTKIKLTLTLLHCGNKVFLMLSAQASAQGSGQEIAWSQQLSSRWRQYSLTLWCTKGGAASGLESVGSGFLSKNVNCLMIKICLRGKVTYFPAWKLIQEKSTCRSGYSGYIISGYQWLLELKHNFCFNWPIDYFYGLSIFCM